MQIKNIVLYKDEIFEPRILEFNIGKTNIISGKSRTGKTALIDIIDYCLGRKSFNVKGKEIRASVSWFAITIQFKNHQVFIARRNPILLNKKTTQDIFFLKSDSIEIPLFNELKENDNTVALNYYLSNILKMSDNLHVADKNTRDSVEATFKHTKYYCFQPQNIIAQPKHLFFKQDEPFIPQTIKDTLPFILGAIREDELEIIEKIRLKKRELNKLLREKKDEKAIYSQSMRKLKSIIEEAQNSELISQNFNYETDKEAISQLKEILNNHQNITSPISFENELLQKLIEKRMELKKELYSIQNEINAIQDFSKNSNEYVSEGNKQYDRLLSIGLYQKPEEHKFWNSIIGKEVNSITPTIELLNQSLIELENSLQYTEKEKPKINKLLIELEGKKNDIESEIKDKNISINNLYKQNEELKRLKDISSKKSYVLGKISLFLDSLNLIKEDSSLNIKIEQLIIDIEDLDSQISKEEKENKLNAILNKINILMTSWNKKLEWEYTDYNLRFDVNKLTVFADSIDGKSEALNEMGSGENWLACHLIVYLALHKHFIDTKRPVPNFIIFDQPTQVHYPTGTTNFDNKKSDDEKADEKMFEFLFEIVKLVSPDLQIIVTDHANFTDNKEFQDSLLEVWDNNKKLVPLEWIK
jgi:hypothetical protein